MLNTILSYLTKGFKMYDIVIFLMQQILLHSRLSLQKLYIKYFPPHMKTMYYSFRLTSSTFIKFATNNIGTGKNGCLII